MRHFQVTPLGGDNRSAFLEFLSAESRHSFILHACKTFESSLVELTVIKVTLVDGTIVFHLTCQGKCFCEKCQRDIKKMSMLYHFLNFPTGRGYGRYPSERTQPHDECSRFTGVHCDYGYTLKSRGHGQQRLNSGSPPAGWFPLPDAVVEAFGLPSICLPVVNFLMSLVLLYGFQLTLKVDTTVCNCSL